ncbi:G-protein coupled receptor Mth2-like isoform X9 [Diabrotica undecimpunctata]|uniref:G-protein coupled receptor Mth2-like isoform X9 n=1 Tax=Diabrotica undecimpunctata TaxID=50387 RepID=UPI003B639DF2
MYSVVILVTLLVQTNMVFSEQCKNFVDITDGSRDGDNIIKDGITYTPQHYFTIGPSVKGCICDIVVCVRKCCAEGETMNMTSKKCVSSYNDSFTKYSVYSIIHVPDNTICTDVETRINLGSDFKIVDGVMLWEDIEFDIDHYCVIKQGEEYFALGCITFPTPIDAIISGLGMIISMPFLLLTFLVYLLLPERNLHRRALMSYVFTLLAAYITLVTIQLYSGQFPDTTCHVLGYLIIFFFLVSFFWMNVMCVDMWLAFSGMRTFLSKKTAERKRFIIYCIYAWGMPIIHVVLVFLINTYGNTVAGYHPQIGVKRCFLGEGMPTFYYFYLPMAILIGINITLFILTTVRIQKIKRETSMLKQTDSRRHTYEDDKQKFNLYLKLMFAMGINWITELVSWAVDLIFSDTPAFVWYITDFTNAMYGLLIFLIFVFKKKIWRSLKKKYYICIGKPHLAHSMTTSSARGTRTSNYSTTDTAVSTDYRLSDMKNGKIPEESALNRS